MSKAVLRCEIIGDPAQFDALTPHWWKLWQQSPSATPFQSPAWLVPWWHAFAPGELATVANGKDGD
ncbi:glycosyl transferase, partial [Mesorhizobium sp. M7A.F.Ca.US.006.04.2.1]